MEKSTKFEICSPEVVSCRKLEGLDPFPPFRFVLFGKRNLKKMHYCTSSCNRFLVASQSDAIWRWMQPDWRESFVKFNQQKLQYAWKVRPCHEMACLFPHGGSRLQVPASRVKWNMLLLHTLWIIGPSNGRGPEPVRRRGPGPQNSQFWGVRILRAEEKTTW